MTVHIHISELSEEVQRLYLEDKIISVHIDYAPSCLMGWVKGTNKEIVVYNFSKFANLVNKHKDYHIYRSKTEIIINII